MRIMCHKLNFYHEIMFLFLASSEKSEKIMTKCGIKMSLVMYPFKDKYYLKITTIEGIFSELFGKLSLALFHILQPSEAMLSPSCSVLLKKA